MKILLLNPPFVHYVSEQPPLGLAYLASISKTKGVDVKIVDANIEQLPIKEIVRRAVEYRPDILGVTMTTPVFNTAVEIITEIKKNISVTAITGGPHPSALPSETLNTGVVDIVCRGEGEETLLDIFEWFKKKKTLKDIPAIDYLNNGGLASNGARDFIDNLDKLPFPDWDGFSLDGYSGSERKENLSLPITTSRGCAAKCCFCYKTFGHRYRFRSPENVVEEIGYLKSRYNIHEFIVIDDSFALINERVKEICRLIIDRKLNLPWTVPSGIRVSPISENLLNLMKKSGCYRVFFGAESGDPEILKNINKGVTLSQIKQAVNLAKRVGLEVGVFFMIGNLGEDEETINKTIRFSLELNPDFAIFNIATPYPGTLFYEKVKQEGRFLFRRWEELSSFDKLVFEHGALTPALANKKYKEAYRKFYLRPRFFAGRLKKIKSLKDVRVLLKGASIFRNITKNKKRIDPTK